MFVYPEEKLKIIYFFTPMNKKKKKTSKTYKKYNSVRKYIKLYTLLNFKYFILKNVFFKEFTFADE